ncbi:MFS transporter [Occultella glacieicola]|uniref:MFS transporter n=2 Tax=Occultella glacieicola TaxID=2518684 RepID=A0ABY2E5G1_9MICO|nr:MFS transporter [Occultella glacieicola]
MCALVFLAAFESLAVTTVMPGISAALDGASLYALAFSGPLAVGIIGMVVAGQWSDRTGPRSPLLASLALFVVGLAIAGLAGSMEILVAGRLLHGLGGGAITVALYVMVARIYPADLHPRIFAGFAAAWVVPSLVGPFLGGLVAEHLGWTWVFHGVILLVVPAVLMLRPALRRLAADTPSARAPWRPATVGWAVLAAAGVLAVDIASATGTTGGRVGAAAAFIVVLLALRPLLPTGALRARRGLPAVITLRGVLSGAFLGAEVYLPYLLTDVHHVSPVLAGFALTFGGLAWALASQIHGRVAARVSDRGVLRLGTSLVLFAIAASMLTSLLAAPPLATVIVWTFAGAGMGLAYPRISTMVLAMSTDTDRGFNSSAATIADSIGGAVALAGTGVVFGTLTGGPTANAPFTGVFALATLFAVGAALLVRRAAASRRAGSETRAAPAAGPEAPTAGPEAPTDPDEVTVAA